MATLFSCALAAFDFHLRKTLKLLAFFLRHLRTLWILSQQLFAFYHSSQGEKNEQYAQNRNARTV